MKFMHGEDFQVSLRTLYQKGGKFQKSAETVQAIWGRAKLNDADIESVFNGIAKTNDGESRLPHCVKYDLTGFARLVTVVNNNVCLFLYAGDHDATSTWLEKNKGLDFVARKDGDVTVIDTVRMSSPAQGGRGRIWSESDLSNGPLIELLPKRYQVKILHNLEEDVRDEVSFIDSVADDDLILGVCGRCGVPRQQEALIDVLLSLRSGDVSNAKTRIDLYVSDAQSIINVDQETIEKLVSGDAAVLLEDVDPELFQHFVQTASFERWMLYLHPAQRKYAEQDFNGPARMVGVSGSGKTCVIVHRALRLADKYQDEPVLVVTLSNALASLIDRLIDAQRGKLRPRNLSVKSIFDLCFDKLMELEPQKRNYYTKRSIAKNPHAISEHIDEVWGEYYRCENNVDDANVMLDVIQSLNARSIYANDYLRQEFDYIRSSVPPGAAKAYLELERHGRTVPIDEKLRTKIFEGLMGWEKKMEAVGVIDDMGIVAALYRHWDKLKPEYRAVLVDEFQDLGTLELSIIRRLTRPGKNDIFLCGDAAQTIYTKSSDLKSSGIDIIGRGVRLNKNYRNSRQILSSAHAVLTNALSVMPKGAVNIEVMVPEFASFSSPKPLLLRGDSFLDELQRGLGFLQTCADTEPGNHRYCVAVCGYSQAAIEAFGVGLKLPILSATTDVRQGKIFISDLEQTKGFEFDAVVVINCSSNVMPHPALPPEESFRDLCRLYVAMTRAKTQLVLTYSGKPSPFIEVAIDTFVESELKDYADCAPIGDFPLPSQSVPALMDICAWNADATHFLKSRDAVGLDRVLQTELLEHVAGRDVISGSKQTCWKTFVSFVEGMKSPSVRNLIISIEAWKNLSTHLNYLRGADVGANTSASVVENKFKRSNPEAKLRDYFAAYQANSSNSEPLIKAAQISIEHFGTKWLDIKADDHATLDIQRKLHRWVKESAASDSAKALKVWRTFVNVARDQRKKLLVAH